MSELAENLIKPISSFDVDVEWLKTLFKVDNIHSGQALDTFKGKGGTPKFISMLGTNRENGINYKDSKETQRRKDYFGENIMVEPPQTTIMEYIMIALDDFTLKILMVAAVCALVINISTEGWAHGWYEGTAIFVAITIITAITVVNDYMQDAQFRKLYKKSQKKIIKVLRNGTLIEIDTTELLAGDIAELETGLIFPADMVLISKNDNFLCDESQMTGEPILIKKNVENECREKESPFLISGTKVMDGSGYGLVCAVGKNCTIGILRASLQTEPEPTPLQLKLEDLANTIGIIGGGGAALTFVGCCLGLVFTCMGSEQEIFSIESAKEVLSYVILAITIIVMAVPEGLPMAVTIALAYSVNEMKKQNNLVRDMAACETMGNATDICSDKTGTLTQNNMNVIDVYISGTLVNVEKGIPEKLLNDPNCIEMSRDVAINSSATPDFKKDKKAQTGNKTEMALLYFSNDMKINYNDYRPSARILKVKPFSSDRKKMTTLYENEDKKRFLLVKGAPDIILKNCNRYRSENGTKQITDDWVAKLFKNVLEVIGGKRARAIGVCKVEVPDEFDAQESNFEDYEKNMEFIGVYGIMDPVRLDVPDAVATCRKAQITVRMVTGDNTLIATAIAKKCGILPKDYNEDSEDFSVMDGAEFREATGGLGWRPETVNGKEIKAPYVKNMTMFTKIASKLKVLGRSLPEDKLLLVTGLQALDRVVAVTGDGTNDAPALKKSNVGFGMGKTGTDVCKDASDIVLIDDNFTSIVTAIKYGRNVFDAIRKFVQFQLTVNFVAMAVAILCGFIIRESPLNAIEMLWLNMIMDSFAALALATEPPSNDLLNRSPTKKKEKIITESMWRTVMINVILQLTTLFIVLYEGHKWIGAPSSIGTGHHWTYENGKHYTFFFDCFVFLQMFNFINARSLKKEQLNPFKNICNNSLFWIIFFITFVGQIAFVQLIGRPVKCTPLEFWIHYLAIAIGSLSLVFGLISKLIPNSLLPIPNFLTENDGTEGAEHGMVSTMRSSLRKRNRSVIIN